MKSFIKSVFLIQFCCSLPLFFCNIYSVQAQNWRQIGQDISSNISSNVNTGLTEVSSDGKIIAVSYLHEGYPNLDTVRIQVYELNSRNNEWVQLGSDITRVSKSLQFQNHMSLSGDGKTLAISHSTSNGISTSSDRSVVDVLSYSNGSWNQKGKSFKFSYITALSIDLDYLGNTIAMNSFAGVIRTFSYDGTSWNLSGDLIKAQKSSHTFYGEILQLSNDGKKLIVGTQTRNKPPIFNPYRGYINVYELTNDDWIQLGNSFYVDSLNSSIYGSLSGDGETISLIKCGSAYHGSQDEGVSTGCNVKNFEFISPDWVQKGDSISGFYLEFNIYDRRGLTDWINKNGERLSLWNNNNYNGIKSIKIYDYQNNGWNNQLDSIKLDSIDNNSISISDNGQVILFSLFDKSNQKKKFKVFSESCSQHNDTSVISCDEFTWEFNSITYTSSGIYRDTILTSNLCDSIVTLNLTILNASDTLISMSNCDEYYWPINKKSYSKSGIYQHKLANSLGCDSTIYLDLTINTSNEKSLQIEVCDSFYYDRTGLTYYHSLTVSDTLLNQKGCDSIISLNLIVNAINNHVKQNVNILNVTEQNAYYKWLNCNLGFQPIVNQTSSRYIADTIGMYAVEISKNGCVDTSDCYTVMEIRNHNCEFFTQIVYPNPTSNEINVELCKEFPVVKSIVRTADGKEVSNQIYYNTNHLVLNFPLTSAVYFIEINTGDKKTVHKVFRDR